ncbi:MAG: hypothetical protein ACI8UR_000815 [Natronomonas sp.]|jgi:hypothetical protein
MANVSMILRRIRKVSQDAQRPPSIGRYQRYEDEYERIFEGVSDTRDGS